MQKSLGFNLLELLVTLAIIVIFVTATLTSFSPLLQRNKTSTVINQLLTAINFARSYAILQNDIVTLCGSSDHQHCDGRWQLGQIVLTESEQGQVLRDYSALPTDENLLWRSNLGKNDFLKFAPTGFTYGQNGSFYYCPKFQKDQYGAIIVVALSGRARVSFDAEQLRDMCG